MNEQSTIAAGTDEPQAPEWNYKRLVCGLVIAFILQSLFHPCLCQIGVAKTTVAIIFDALMILRIVVARMLHERGKGWVFYLVLIYTSPLWIELASWITIGRH